MKKTFQFRNMKLPGFKSREKKAIEDKKVEKPVEISKDTINKLEQDLNIKDIKKKVIEEMPEGSSEEEPVQTTEVFTQGDRGFFVLKSVEEGYCNNCEVPTKVGVFRIRGWNHPIRLCVVCVRQKFTQLQSKIKKLEVV